MSYVLIVGVWVVAGMMEALEKDEYSCRMTGKVGLLLLYRHRELSVGKVL